MIVAPSFEPGTLLGVAERRARAAREAGALQPFASRLRFVADGGIRFIVRVLASLETKEGEQVRRRLAASAGTPPVNPFLPYDERLFVADISPSHLCLLNKFNVVDRHILIVTRAYEDQEAALTAADLSALALCLSEIDGLGFFNGGTFAGASQPHKHLQLVPLPLAAEGPPLPVEAALADVLAAAPGEPIRAAGLPFRHVGCRLPDATAGALEEAYRGLLAAAGLFAGKLDREAGEKLLPPYNLLVTRTWMLLIPRTREKVEGISINALGFAGSLVVRDETQMATVTQLGPMRMLRAAALPAHAR